MDDMMEEMREEWGKMMESMRKLDDMMKTMPAEKMEEKKMEWEKVKEDMNNMQGMMEGM